MTTQASRRRRDERGIALIISVLVLVLVSAIAITAIEHAGEESAAAGRSRAAGRALQTAEAGIQLALNRIGQNPPNLVPFDVTLPDGKNVQSRTKADAAPQPIPQVGLGPPPQGYSINVGSGYANEVYRVNVTASSNDGGTTELEAKVGRLIASVGGY